MEQEVLSRETTFHDEWAESVSPEFVQVDALENACTMPETRYIIQTIGKGNFAGKKILDIGCACGEASVYFAKQGAHVTATDLSKGMVNLAQRVAEFHNVHLETVACSADDLPFDDDTFDIVYVANVMHHVDIEKTLPDIKRVLKPGGKFISWDPVKYNPAINLYRKLATDVRTVDEHPIDINYIRQVQKYFNNVRNKGFWLLTNLVFVKYYFIDKLDPSKVRYWKKVVSDAEEVKDFYLSWERIDKALLGIFPFLKWLCWNMVVIAEKY